MANDAAAKYKVYSIRRLPAGVWGESYAVVTAFESGPDELTTEHFVLTKRPSEKLHSGRLQICVGAVPSELGSFDMNFALQEGFREAELHLMDLLDRRADELQRPDVALLQFELQPVDGGHIVGSWMRGLFNDQFLQIEASTECGPLKRYLSFLPQVPVLRTQ